MSSREKLALAPILLFMGVAFYMMCASNPLRWDDLMYQYVWMDHRDPALLHPVDLDNRVDNLAEAWASQLNHYKVMNGRFIVHFITQCFCGFIGKGAFNYVNTLVYVLFLVLSIRFLRVRSLSGAVLTVAGLWFLLPCQWVLSFDVVFPINYLWSATACVAFLSLFHRMGQQQETPLASKVLLVIFGIFCGNFHEGYTLLISGALFFHALFHFRRISAGQWCMILGMWVGTLTVIGSPGIWGRAAGATPETFVELLARKMDILRYSKRLYLLLLIVGAGYLTLGKRRMAEFLKAQSVELTVVVLGLMFLFMLPYYSQRMGFPMELFAVLLSLKLLMQLSVKRSLRPYAAVAVCLMLAVHVYKTVECSQEVGKEYRAMMEEYEQSPEGITHFQDIRVAKPFVPYVLRMDIPFEQGLISFTHRKKMIVEE